MLCVWGLYNLLYVYLYLQYIHVYIYIFNMIGIMYQLYDMCVCVWLMLFSVCFGVTMFGEPWLRPPALWNQLRATRPGPAARKIIMKPMISKLSTAFGHKKKHNPKNLTRKHKENHYNWQFQLISMGGIGEKNTSSADFSSGNNWGQGPEFATVTPCPCKAEWLGSLPGILVEEFFPQFWWWKVTGIFPTMPETIQDIQAFREIEQWLLGAMTAQQSLIFTDFCGWSEIFLWLSLRNTLGTLKKFGSATPKKNNKAVWLSLVVLHI